MSSLKFTVFADFHYKYMMYYSSVKHLDEIIERANLSKSEMIIHCGDFSNDYIGSPEIVNLLLKNKYGIKAYGVYGNHELESKDNSMEYVTPLLTNDEKCVWGTQDGKMSVDGSIGYYYVDKGDFRFVFTDTNYSYNLDHAFWEHNVTNSYGPRSTNKLCNSLSPKQLYWLDNTLIDAAQNCKKCIIISHATFSDIYPNASKDAPQVRAIFRKANLLRPNTVILAINGHYHTNHLAEREGVVYFDCNTTNNGYWQPQADIHYTDEHKFISTEYDDEGMELKSTVKPLSALSMSAKSWYFEKPLSATITVDSDANVTVEGMQTNWIYDISKQTDISVPWISSGEFHLKAEH